MNMIILFFLLFFPIQTLKAQEFRWDCSSSVSIGYAKGVNVYNMSEQRCQVPQDLLSLNIKLSGLFFGCDFHKKGDRHLFIEERSTAIAKIGYGYRYDKKVDNWAIAFTPYIGKAWYDSDGYKLNCFVYGTRLSFLYRALETSLEVSNRTFGVTVGLVYWNVFNKK